MAAETPSLQGPDAPASGVPQAPGGGLVGVGVGGVGGGCLKCAFCHRDAPLLSGGFSVMDTPSHVMVFRQYSAAVKSSPEWKPLRCRFFLLLGFSLNLSVASKCFIPV